MKTYEMFAYQKFGDKIWSCWITRKSVKNILCYVFDIKYISLKNKTRDELILMMKNVGFSLHYEQLPFIKDYPRYTGSQNL
jgi:hypothetical protein